MITGKGMYIWNAWNTEGGNADQALAFAKEAGFTHVLIKIADGPWTHNIKDNVDYALRFCETFKRGGLFVFGWQYVYGRNPEAEADMAVRRVLECGVDGFVVNAEVEYKYKPDQATRYMKRLRNALKDDYLIGLSSYRFPNIHREFPFNQFLEYCDVNLPQVYWMKATNAGQQLLTSINQCRQSWLVQRPILPTGAAFQEHGWRPTPEQVFEFLNTAKQVVHGANFWVWEHARRLSDVWQVLRNYQWEEGMTEQSVMNNARLRVVVPSLNVRSGPGVNWARVGQLVNGSEVAVEAISVEGPSRVWIKHSIGWSALVYDRSIFLQGV